MRSYRRPARPFWLRVPRRTARLRLTALYGGLYLVSGVILLAITYLLFERATGGGITRSAGATAKAGVIRQVPGPSDAAQRAVQHASDQHQLLVNSGIALAAVAMLALLIGWLFAGRMLRPVRTITATVRRISASNLHERLALQNADEEFKHLGDALDGLLARLDAAFEVQRHFVANASHELRSPITRERALLEVALGDPSTPPTWTATGQKLLASNREQERLIDALLTLATSEASIDHLQPVDLATIAESVLLTSHPEADSLGIRVHASVAAARLQGDPALLERLVANVVNNAIRHNVKGGEVDVSTSERDGRAVLSVTNTGPVIPKIDVDRLFQPFQRLDPGRTHHRHGHGLGLSIVRAIASAHGATISAKPQAKGGLAVAIIFPPSAHPKPARTNPIDSRRARSHGNFARLGASRLK